MAKTSIAPGISGKVYLTPQIEKQAKRREGLCPSLLMDNHVQASHSKHGNGHTALTKSYQTNSTLLTSTVRDLDNDAEELKFIVDSVNKYLSEIVDEKKKKTDLISMKFIPKGCCWILELNSDVGAPDYIVTVNVLAKGEGNGTTTFVVDTNLVGRSSKSVTSTSLPGFREAKGVMEHTALAVRKGVVRCEFPVFPEGLKGKTFREIYQLNARLKSGSFATVCRGTHRASGKKVAIKCVLRKDLPPTDDAAIYDEVAIMSSLSHPHIVPLIDFFEEKDCYFLVMELMSGGDLFDRIGKKKFYSEADARDLAVKMLKAMAYCHSHQIAHCDMKPKNLLLMSEDNDSYIKLADFGFAARCHTPKSLTKQCGTPFFVSPEILMRQPYDQQSDMWSVGCIIFLLLSGNLPFMGRSQKELFRKIVSGKFEFDEEDWCDVSSDAKDLVQKLLVLDPDERLTSSQALKHQWMKASAERLSRMGLQGTSQRLKTFNARMKLRSALIAVDWVNQLKKTSWISNNRNR
ncbi:serine/threonine protein kinase [Nitzschia inconspicua]|uniref:Serine/threonine protein kinase n=1 Tax=Nitzschia inconspicua TaxID=303405 RepID=A0A9K3LX92_9STRA|nr:serine/threonine protein kinase [Nitzschia inconspicua]KAG7369789.1 serine/threonine protein kinase [Nitzschia inconspicua]